MVTSRLHQTQGGPVSVVVVSFESGAVLDRCLASLPAAAPRRGVAAWVADNASSDDSVGIALRHLPADRVLRLSENRGFAAGVNAALGRVSGQPMTPWIAIVNPDTIVPPGTLDTLCDVLERHPRAGLAAPHVVRPDGRPEASVGRFPTPRRERNHALKLDRVPGPEGRTCPFPHAPTPVDWVSGCAWLLRVEAILDTGPLDEGFFMYYDDVDYCRRLWSAGWEVLATPEAEVIHAGGEGSRATPLLPAEGGRSPLRYFSKHLTRDEEACARRWLERGWRLRALAHGLRGIFGHSTSIRQAARYRLALDRVSGR